MSLSLNDLRNNYAIMYDTITKNLEKINNPRSQVKSATQHLECCPCHTSLHVCFFLTAQQAEHIPLHYEAWVRQVLHSALSRKI